MSKQQSPLNKVITLFTKYYNFYSEGNPKKEAFKEAIEDLKVFLPEERQFAQDAYTEGGLKTIQRVAVLTPFEALEAKTFTDYYKQYEP